MRFTFARSFEMFLLNIGLVRKQSMPASRVIVLKDSSEYADKQQINGCWSRGTYLDFKNFLIAMHVEGPSETGIL